MKNLLILFFATALLVTINSCDKDKDTDSNKLDAPELLTPSNGQVSDGECYCDFDWTDVLNATEYFIEVSTSADFSTIEYSYSTTESDDYDYFINNTVSDVTYYWHVKAIGTGFETSDYSNTYSFTITPSSGSSGSFNLLSPPNNNTNTPLTATFTCESVPNATLYTFYFESLNQNFTETSVSPQTTSSQLTNNTIYTWRVLVDISGGGAEYSDDWSFETEPPSGVPPTLLTPPNGVTVTTTTPTFTWSSVAGATSYTGELALDAAFNNILASETVSGTSFSIPSATPLISGSTYYWRVKANNSNYSGVFSFTVN